MRSGIGISMVAVLIGLAGIAVPAQAQSTPPALNARYVSDGYESVPHDVVAPMAVDGESEPGVYETDCSFDAYGHYHESLCRQRRPWFRWLPRHGMGHGNRWDECGDPCDFPYSHAWSRIDVEKRIFVAYAYDGGQGDTRLVYGDGDSGQIGLEVLPFVCRDGSSSYLRWGFTTMFDYTHYRGNEETTLFSRASRNFLTVSSAETFSFIVGPTVRIDFELLRLRMSPNATMGVAFDWTSVSDEPPRGGEFYSVPRFKYTGFDAGGYLRLMWDIGLTRKMNFGIGGEYRFTPTDVMFNNDTREFLGLVLQLSHEF